MRKFPVAGTTLAGILLLSGSAVPTRADGFLRRCGPACGSDCTSEVVKIPGHEIVVETARPQVIVNETRVAKPRRVVTTVAAPVPVQAVAPAPMVATIFTPMQVPMAHIPMTPVVNAGLTAAPPVCQERSTLDALHAMETHALEARKLQAAHQLELEHANDALQRMSASLQKTLSTTKTIQTVSADNSDLQALATEIGRLKAAVNASTDRSNRFEGLIKELQQMVLLHDDVIKKKVLVATNGSPADTKKLEDMIRELQKLVLKHDDLLRELVMQRGGPLPPMPPALNGAPLPMAPPDKSCAPVTPR